MSEHGPLRTDELCAVCGIRIEEDAETCGCDEEIEAEYYGAR